LLLSNDTKLAFHHHKGKSPGLVFLPGFLSNMNGQKTMALEGWCKQQGRQFTRFDYSGHGQSTGKIEDGTIGMWLRDALQIVDQITLGPQVLVGSSMGGWIMLLVAMARKERIQGLVGIAAAPDFTERFRSEWLDPPELQQLNDTGYCDIHNTYDDETTYRISRNLLEEATNHFLLNKSEIPIDTPVRLFHGLCDEEIPWQYSVTLAQKLKTDNVELQLIKSGDHRLSEPRDLHRLVRTIEDLLAGVDGP